MDLKGLAPEEVAATGLPIRLMDSILPQLIARNFLVFLNLELGFEVARPQKEWWAILREREDSVILAPRDHGKSHTIVRGYAAWKAKYDPFVSEILFLGPDGPSAIENLDKFKQMLSACPTMVDLLPTDRKLTNTRQELRLKNGVTIKAKGFFSTLRGRHPQLILLDDVVNENNSMTFDGRVKVKNYFFSVVYPMKDKGTAVTVDAGYKPQIVMVGTAQNEEDIYHELHKNPMFVGLRQTALVDPDTETVLWPERYSWDALMKIKAAMGSLRFAQEYCNEPITEDTSLFPPSLFVPMYDYNRSYLLDYDGSNPVYMGVDFSVPGEMSGDFTVAAVAEKLQGDMLNIIAVWRDKPVTMREQVEKIAEMTRRFKVTNGFLEANLFQRVYPEHFKRYSNLPLKGHVVTSSNKNSFENGVLSFRPIFENQKFIFPYKTPADQEKTDIIVREFGGMVRKDGKLGNFRYHDDCVMALWHCLCASRQTMFSYDM